MSSASRIKHAGSIQHDELLGLVGHELADLAVEMQALQAILSPALVEAARAQPDALTSFQALDRIEQTLTNLSRLMSALQRQGQAVHPVAAQGALGELSMVDLRRRLGCLTLARSSSPAHSEAEFF